MDARRFLRYRLQLPVTLGADGPGAPCSGNTTVVSRGGMEIACDAANIACLLPEGHRITPDSRATMQFAISLGGAHGTVRGAGRVLNARRLAQDEFRLGFEILDLDTDTQRHLTEFLDQCTPAP